MSTAPNAGWYADPQDASSLRYWNGESWTESRTPANQSSSPEKVEHAEGADVAGYVLAVLFPLVGFIIGLVRLNRSRHGIWIVVTSVVAFILWIVLVAGSADSGATY